MNTGINPINVDTHRDVDRPLTAGEITAAALSELRANISQPTLTLIKETNKVVSEVKLDDTHLAIHALSRQLKGNDLAVFLLHGCGAR